MGTFSHEPMDALDSHMFSGAGMSRSYSAGFVGPEAKLQMNLSVRDFGGPREQTVPAADRLRGVRETLVMHSSIETPLTSWKTLEPFRPRWPHLYNRYHLRQGLRVVDTDTVQLSARDTLRKTSTRGLLRSSGCRMTFAHSHLQKAELDVTLVITLLHEQPPSGAYAWTLRDAEASFRNRSGRPGVWRHYALPFGTFVNAFPRTFERYGESRELMRLRFPSSPVGILDKMEDAMVRIAKSRGDMGFEVEAAPRGPGFPPGEPPDSGDNRVKAVVRPMNFPDPHLASVA